MPSEESLKRAWDLCELLGLIKHRGAIADAFEERDEDWQQYVSILHDEISDLMPIAFVHGWQSTRHEAGLAARKKLGIKGVE